MEWQGFKSNTTEGDSFIVGMINYNNKRERDRDLFYAFIKSLDVVSWHIHDGWVMKDYTNGQFPLREATRLNWIDGHAGYSHSSRKPCVGERIILLSDSPDSENKKPFPAYIFERKTNNENDFLVRSINLKFIERVDIIFQDNKYQLYIKPIPTAKKWLQKIFG